MLVINKNLIKILCSDFAIFIVDFIAQWLLYYHAVEIPFLNGMHSLLKNQSIMLSSGSKIKIAKRAKIQMHGWNTFNLQGAGDYTMKWDQ